MCVLSLDLSLTNTGGCIFTEEGEPIYVFSVPSSSRFEQWKRLKIIGSYLENLKKSYAIDTVVFEDVFSRFNLSTKSLYKLQGVASYIFADCEQLFYAPSSIKKVVAGSGRAEKKEVEEAVLRKYPGLMLANLDESDAVSVGMCYFKKKDEKNA